MLPLGLAPWELLSPAVFLCLVHPRLLARLALLPLLSACGSQPPPVPNAAVGAQTEPQAAAPEGDEPLAAMPARAPQPNAECPFHWTPHDIGASVIRIPAAVASRFMTPLVDAACACVRPGERVQILANIVPERGTIEAKTVDREEPEARSSASIDACLKEALHGTTFETFELGSDVVCPEPPPPPSPHTKGPPFFRPPRLAGCPAPGSQTSKILYPLLVDWSEHPPEAKHPSEIP